MGFKYLDNDWPDGTVFGQDTSALISFYGVDPVAQPAAVTTVDSTTVTTVDTTTITSLAVMTATDTDIIPVVNALVVDSQLQAETINKLVADSRAQAVAVNDMIAKLQTLGLIA